MENGSAMAAEPEDQAAATGDVSMAGETFGGGESTAGAGDHTVQLLDVQPVPSKAVPPPAVEFVAASETPDGTVDVQVFDGQKSDEQQQQPAQLAEVVVDEQKQTLNGVEDQLKNGDVEVTSSPAAANDGSVPSGGSAVVDDQTVVDADGYRVEERRETEQTTRTEEVHERPDGAEEVVVHETREVVMEEVKSKETERSATDEEIRALLGAEITSGKTADDGVIEISLGRDVLVEEFTRLESTREEKVAGEVAVSTATVTEEHKTEEIHEVPLAQSHLTNGTATDVDEHSSEPATVVEAIEVEPTPAAETEVALAAAVVEAAPPLTVDTDVPEGTAASAPSPSADENKTKDKSPKSKGFIGFLKSKARSQSRERDESAAAAKDEQKPKELSKPEDGGKSGTLDREHKKFKLNLFGKKSDDEKAEKTDD
jgi:hypothetical protein